MVSQGFFEVYYLVTFTPTLSLIMDHSDFAIAELIKQLKTIEYDQLFENNKSKREEMQPNSINIAKRVGSMLYVSRTFSFIYTLQRLLMERNQIKIRQKIS